MRIEARAKINWALNVLGLLPDNYHRLDMLVQRLALSDTVELLPAAHLSIEVTGDESVPADPSNLAYRAAMELKLISGYKGGARIKLSKRIPALAGLGGGSADAAAVLEGLNELWGLDFKQNTLMEVGRRLGADVPLCLFQGLMRAGGIGDEIKPLSGGKQLHLLLLKPVEGLSSREVFQSYDEAPDPLTADITAASIALRKGDLEGMKATCYNQLQETAIRLLPGIRAALEALTVQGAVFAQMSGSGSAVFGVFQTEAAAKEAETALSPAWPVCLATHTRSY